MGLDGTRLDLIWFRSMDRQTDRQTDKQTSWKRETYKRYTVILTHGKNYNIDMGIDMGRDRSW